MVNWYEVAFDRLYPILYRHRDEEEARRAAASFGRLFEGKGPVLDIACGSGRHMEAFAARGVRVVGLDLSMFLLERAVASPGQRGRVVQGDMRALPFVDGSFGGAVNMFTSFGYFDTDGENQRVLDEVGRVLGRGGAFLIDFLNAHTVLRDALGRTRRESEGYTIDEDRSLSEDGRTLIKRVVVARPSEDFCIEYDERVRLFEPDELIGMVRKAGFEVTGVFGDYDATAFDTATSPRVIAACERRWGKAERGC